MTTTIWRNRIVDHRDVAPGELVPNPRNWRTHPQGQRRALAGALGEVGWVAEVLVGRRKVDTRPSRRRVMVGSADQQWPDHTRRDGVASADNWSLRAGS